MRYQLLNTAGNPIAQFTTLDAAFGFIHGVAKGECGPLQMLNAEGEWQELI
jgi:hypothetical protein